MLNFCEASRSEWCKGRAAAGSRASRRRFPEDPGSRFPPLGAALAADGWELRPSSGTALGRRHLGAAPSQQASSCSFNSDISGAILWGVGLGLHCSPFQLNFSPTSHLHANRSHHLLAGEPNLRHRFSCPQRPPVVQCPASSGFSNGAPSTWNPPGSLSFVPSHPLSLRSPSGPDCSRPQ